MSNRFPRVSLIFEPISADYYYPTYATDPIAYCLQLWGDDFQHLITDNLYCKDECYLDEDESEADRDASCLACFTQTDTILEIKQDYKDTFLIGQGMGSSQFMSLSRKLQNTHDDPNHTDWHLEPNLDMIKNCIGKYIPSVLLETAPSFTVVEQTAIIQGLMGFNNHLKVIILHFTCFRGAI